MLSFLLILCVWSIDTLLKVTFSVLVFLFSAVNHSVFCFELTGIDVFFLSMLLCLLYDKIMISVIDPAYC